MNRDSISFVMPALNEEINIGKSIKMVQAVAIERSLEYELTIINDGSVDNTRNISNNYAKKDRNIKVICHE